MKKSITWQYVVVLSGLSIAWFSGPLMGDWKWVVIGVICGLTVEAISFFLRRIRKKLSNTIETVILLSCIFLGFLSVFVGEMLGIAVGIILAIIIAQVSLQVYYRKVFTWEDFQEERSKWLGWTAMEFIGFLKP